VPNAWQECAAAEAANCKAVAKSFTPGTARPAIAYVKAP